MSKSSKPYPGMGAFVLLLNYGDEWIVHCGANTEDKLRAERRKLAQWPIDKTAIVPNAPGNDPKFTTYN